MVLSEQLREERVVEGEVWSTYHMTHEFCSPNFADSEATCDVISPVVAVYEVMQGRLKVVYVAAGGKL